ncbi:putative F-box associated interaction domain-containing protein [Arabidopsis thaliana]
MKGIGKLTSLNNLDQVEISKVFHCNGLLLCLTKDKTRLTSLVVWNPYLGQTRWIKPRHAFHRLDVYALGYDKNLKNHKILRFVDSYEPAVKHSIIEHEIFDLKSNAWRVLDVTPDWEIDCYQRGVSLKGSTYFFAKEKIVVEGDDVVVIEDFKDFLICFDFTSERFGPRLPLPFHSYNGETVTLSSVREEQLAVLYQQDTCLMEIWVTNKIEPDVVSWSKVFLGVDMEPLTGSFIPFAFFAGSFFIDEEKKIAVVFDKDQEEINDRAYLIGENGYYKEVDLGYMNGYYQQQVDPRGPDPVFPLVCSYSPSLVTIPQGTRGKRKERDY